MADVELLPLPKKSVIDRHLPTGVRVYGYTSEDMRGYAQACIAQQPATVDEAMVERALNARYNGYDVACYMDEAVCRGVIHAALTAALAAQPGGGR